MAERQWTVVLVPHGARGSRTIRVSQRALRIGVGALVTAAVGVVILGYTILTKTIDLARLDRLEKRNELLTAELDQAEGLIAAINDSVSAIARRDEQIRLLAGLEPTDPDVQLAGVGGPAGRWTEREEILSGGPTGRRALSLGATLDQLLRRANLLALSYGEAVESLEVHVDRSERTPSIWPIDRSVGWPSSPFTRSRMHPIHHEARPHEGIDISAPNGAPIMAPGAGRVKDVSRQAGYGNIVTIDHGYGVVTRYAHCSKILVRVGQRVQRGDRIALVGKTGWATAPHLHYEVLVNGSPRNPRGFIFPDVIVD